VGISALATGDVDADGDLDLVATTSASGAVRVLLNGGNATLAAAVSFATSAGDAVSVTLGDVNLDGRLDIVAVAHAGLNGSLLLNAGN
jgi:hypothetical protein